VVYFPEQFAETKDLGRRLAACDAYAIFAEVAIYPGPFLRLEHFFEHKF
jgi:hypothetical protein